MRSAPPFYPWNHVPVIGRIDSCDTATCEWLAIRPSVGCSQQSLVPVNAQQCASLPVVGRIEWFELFLVA